MDEGIGRVLDTLRDSGLHDDTMVDLISDHRGERFPDAWPFIGHSRTSAPTCQPPPSSAH